MNTMVWHAVAYIYKTNPNKLEKLIKYSICKANKFIERKLTIFLDATVIMHTLLIRFSKLILIFLVFVSVFFPWITAYLEYYLHFYFSLALYTSSLLRFWKRTETSYTYSQFQKSGRFTAPATVIPRFKNYSVDDFHFLAVLGKGSFGKVSISALPLPNNMYYIFIFSFRCCWPSCVTQHITMRSSASRRTLCWRTTTSIRHWSSAKCSHWAPSIPICAICFAPFKQR